MGAIQNVSTAFPASTGVPSAAAAAPEDPQQRFLTLLVTQLKNQDPLNPMDNSQLTSQMAQLNMVSGINQLNTTLQSLAANFSATQSLQAASIVGHGVLIAGSTLALANGQGMFGVDLPQSVNSLVVTVRDAAGNVVHQFDVGPQPAGTVALAWDGATDSGGSAPAGVYRFEVNASAGTGKVDATTLSYGVVQGVSSGLGGVQLNIQGVGTAPLANVKEII